MLENCTFLRKGLEVCKNHRTFARVFFIVLDLRLTKVWVTAVTLFLCLISFSSSFRTNSHTLSVVYE